MITTLETPTCARCASLGDESSVHEKRSVTSAIKFVAFIDSRGRRHVHDPNVIRTRWACSRGHEWIVATGQECWCGWPPKIVARP